MSYCKKCGRQINLSNKFCGGCGTEITDQKNIIEDVTKWEGITKLFFLIIILGIIGYYFNNTVKQEPLKQETSSTATTTIYFTNDDTSVFSSPSETSELMGVYPINTELNINIPSINPSSEWVELVIPFRDSDSRMGYINKKYLSSGKTKIVEKIVKQNLPSVVTTPKTTDLISIIKEWRKSTAYIECFWYYPNNSLYFLKQTGSGLLIKNTTGSLLIATNKHIVNNLQYGTARECYAFFPDDKYTSYSVITSDIPALNLKNGITVPAIPAQGRIDFATNGSDVAYLSDLKLMSLQPPIISLAQRARGSGMCHKEPEIGEPIVILGYPTYGSGGTKFDATLTSIELTATEGIISGNDGYYYTTSAKIEHGNSGGLAIDENGDCYLGIPTASITGEIESLGRILPAKYIFNN